MTNILGCGVEKLPTVYLGMFFGSKHIKLEIWDVIIEKTKKKLAMWKSHYLSLGGKSILINFVLDFFPTYMMFLFSMSSKIIKTLHSLRRNFLAMAWQQGGQRFLRIFSLIIHDSKVFLLS